MVERLRRLMGRPEIRILVLMVCCILLAGLAVSIAQLTRTSSNLALPTVSSWDELLKDYLLFREFNYPLVVPDECLPYGELEATLKKYTLGDLEKQPGWYWNFDGGTFVFEADSELAKQLGESADLVVYEDMENGEILILRVPENENEDYREEIVYRAPEWPQEARGEATEIYLWRELSKRRIALQVTLKTRKLAEEEEYAEETEPALLKTSGEDLLLRFGEDYTNHLWLSVEGQNHGLTNVVVGVHVPDGFTNRLEVFAITNLLSFPWSMVETNLSVDGANVVYWADPAQDDWETCFYAVGNADSDTDEDGIPGAREKFLYGTDPQNEDTDGDGASDGDELAAATDPLNNSGDRDGDGLSDDLETVLGTDPDEADTDLDWASDGYEVQKGTDPLNPASTPSLYFTINANELYTRSTFLELSFPGLVADVVLLSELMDMSHCVTGIMNNVVYYTLPHDTNGLRRLYAQLRRITDGQRSPGMSRSIILDTEPPTVTLSNPTNGAVTDRRWIRVEGVATDSVSAVSVFVNGEWADGVISNRIFVYDRLYLDPGTNDIEIVGRDYIGNSTTQRVSVVLDPSGDATPPSLILDLPKDVVATNGITNHLDTTTFGVGEILYLKGSTDDETAEITFWVFGLNATNGPYIGNPDGTQFVGEVRLFPGTNVLCAFAADAAGNTATNLAVIIRQTNYIFAITSPEAYQVMNCASVAVSGVASPMFLNATIAVNGVGTLISNESGHITFTTTAPVPLNSDWTYLLAEAHLDGRVYYADPPINGYEIEAWNHDYHSVIEQHTHWPESTLTYYHRISMWDNSWSWDSRSCLLLDSWEFSEHEWFLYEWGPSEAHSYDSTNEEYYHSPPAPSVHYGTWDDECNWQSGADFGNYTIADRHPGSLNFIKRGSTQETQLVVLKFPGMNYSRGSGEPFDPTLITYRGQTGFWHNGCVSFLVPIRTGIRYVVNEAEFAWPHSFYYGPDWLFPGTLVSSIHRLFHEGVSNAVLKVEIKAENGADDPKEYLDADTEDVGPFYSTVKYKAVVTPTIPGAFSWSTTSTKITLVDASSQTVTINAGPDASSSVDAEQIKVDFTPSGSSVSCDDTHALTVVHCTYAAYSDRVGLGHGWWRFGIGPSDASALIEPANLRSWVNTEVGYFPETIGAPISPGYVLKGPQGHTSTSQHTWDIPFILLDNGLSYSRDLSISPGTYNVLLNNCCHKVIESSCTCGVNIPNDKTDPETLHDYLSGL